ncbi:cytochrome P450 27C1-like [Mizuhopecten yessoensis]|uniref:cytochrome P450 27C1-like n=1 Tax=Mizuhopecten yessoensis TaxID=6573 RepID=UPI000B45C5D6|nr:cytochrome P450 27C1-like [Mizuhopecten yessoensis]XP_021365827.1 cytochrome P450 27C1-like [Mizuhopecten yessoensis]
MAEPAIRQVAKGVGRAVTKSGVRRHLVSAPEGRSVSEDVARTAKPGVLDTHRHHNKVQPPVMDSHRHQATLAAAPAQFVGADTTTVKTIQDLPGPKGLPVLGTAYEYFRKGNRGQMHKVQTNFHKKYGKFFKEQLGPVTNVSIADPRLIEEISRKETKLPFRPPYESWVLYKKMRGQNAGIMSGVGEEWKTARSVLSQRMLKPKVVSEYSGVMNEVSDAFMDRLRLLRDTSNQQGFIPGLVNELNKWSTETITAVLLEKRLGFYDERVPPEAQEFIDSVISMFLTGHQLMVFANVHKALGTKVWREHVKAMDSIYRIAEKLIDEKLNQSKRLADLDDKEFESATSKGSAFLDYLFASKKLSSQDIKVNTTELLLGAVDTAANGLGFAMCLLAQNPRVQERFHREVQEQYGKGKHVNYNDLQEASYVKAIVKETLRIYPVIPINARVLSQDTVVGNHSIPKGTCILFNNYTMFHDESYFPDHDEFRPERWIRKGQHKEWDPFTTLVFGFGARSCIGRRVAEQELYIALMKITQNFWLEPTGDPVEPTLRTILTQKEIPVQFIDR